MAAMSPRAVAARGAGKTFEEAGNGYKEFDGVQGYGTVGPAKLPAQVTQRLNAEIDKALVAPLQQECPSGEAIDPTPMTPDQSGRFIQGDVARRSKLARERNISLDDQAVPRSAKQPPGAFDRDPDDRRHADEIDERVGRLRDDAHGNQRDDTRCDPGRDGRCRGNAAAVGEELRSDFCGRHVHIPHPVFPRRGAARTVSFLLRAGQPR